MAASASRNSLESAPQVAVLLLEHDDAGCEFSDPRLEGGEWVAGLSQLGDREADREQEAFARRKRTPRMLFMVVATSPHEGVDGALIEFQLASANHACLQPREGAIDEAGRQGRGGSAPGEASTP